MNTIYRTDKLKARSYFLQKKENKWKQVSKLYS